MAVASLNLIPTMPGSEDLAGAPDRAYLTPGVPVDDCCEQLTVYVDPVGQLDTARAARVSKFAWINMASFTITTGRCLPGSNFEGVTYVAPTPEAMSASARQLNADGMALWNGMRNAYRDGLILAGCELVRFRPLVARNPSGGCGGWTLVVEAQVDGYEADLEIAS